MKSLMYNDRSGNVELNVHLNTLEILQSVECLRGRDDGTS